MHNPPPKLRPSSPAKRLFDRCVPFVYRPVRGAYHRWQNRRFRRRYQHLVGLIVSQVGWEVQTGPFQGMRYVQRALSSALLPKLLGTYENELHPALEKLLETSYEAVVDIGSAEGYYAVGLARRLAEATVYGYDMDPDARAMCGELAVRNGVADRVVIRDQFTPDHLAELPGERFLVVCDVDGYETELFKPELAHHWAGADLIVELHDCFGLPCRDQVTACLAPSHDLEVIPSGVKTFPPGVDIQLPEDDRRLTVDELRPPQAWLIARPRATGL